MESNLQKRNQLPAMISLSMLMATVVLVLFAVRYLEEVSIFLKSFLAYSSFYPAAYGLLLLLAITFFLLYRSRSKASKIENELARLTTTLDPNVQVVVDTENKILLCKGSVERVLGYRPEELIGHSVKKIFSSSPERMKSKYTFFDKDTGSTYSLGIVAEGKKKGGASLALEVNIGEMQSTKYKVLTLCDVSKKKAVETEVKALNRELDKRVRERTIDLQEAYAELRGVYEMRDAILSSMSNELIRPLTSIRASAETLLTDNEKMSPIQRDLITIIFNQSEGCINSVNDVLKHETHDVKTNWFPKRLDVRKTLKRTIDARANDLNSQNLNLRVELAKGLPQFIADEERIHQVFSNLLSNAIKFTSPGGNIKIKAKVIGKKRSEDKTDYVIFSISDTGVGMAGDDLSRVFTRFISNRDEVQDSERRPIQGLSICKDIITYHGGRIWIESALGKGTTVYFTIPVSSPLHTFQDQRYLEKWSTSRLLCN